MLGNSIMQQHVLSKVLPVLFISSLLVNCSNEDPASADLTVNDSNAFVQQSGQSTGVIAKVGDEIITFNQLNTMLNSSAMVGLSIPALGTQKRNQVIITLLDKVISANLIYLDAKKNGADRLASYTDDLKKFEDAILVTMYRSQVMIGDIPVSDEEVSSFYNDNISKEAELNDDVKLAIEAKIRKQKFADRKDSISERLRADARIGINEDVLSTGADVKRSDVDIVATIADKNIYWSDIKDQMRGADHRATLSAFYIDNDEERLKRLQAYIDNDLMLTRALAADMDKSEEFVKRTEEYRKTSLINVYRTALLHGWQPSEDELKTTFVDNMDKISVPEARKVQTVVVKTKEEAESIKADIDSGKITMFQAAQQYSLDPNAKHTLGDLGWVSHGTGFKELDDFTFNLDPEVVGGPVKTPAGWQLVKVLDVNDAQFQNFDDPQTRKLTLRLHMQKKFNDYVVDLRKNDFEVTVYEAELNRHFQKEADYIAALTVKAKEQGSITEQRLEGLQKYITPSAK